MIHWLEAAMLAEREAPRTVAQQVKRLSIDMPATLHRRFRRACIATDRVMVSEILAFIERTAELEKR
jgi:hypothetical protein